MSVSEIERVELVSRLADAIGEEATETLMKCVLPEGRDQLATKADLGVLKIDLKVLETETKAEFARLRADLDTRFANTETELARLRADMETGFATIRAEFRSEFAKQTRRHYGSMVIFIASVWGVLIPQIFV